VAMICSLEVEAPMSEEGTIETVENAIHLIRGQRVMLDSDLARIYGTSTMRLNEQCRRNRKRFPLDFAFQLAREEFTNLVSQNAISSSHGGRRKLPWVFTEHGAIMLAVFLIHPSRLRQVFALCAPLCIYERSFRRMRSLPRRFQNSNAGSTHTTRKSRKLFAVIRQLLAPAPGKKREIGFHVKERSSKYRAARKV